MALVPAICTQCGAQIEVDNTREAGICKFCGTAFITEKAINNYNIQNTYNIQNANIVMQQKNLENLKKLADTDYKNERYETAENYYRQILEIEVNDYESEFKRSLCLCRKGKVEITDLSSMKESLKDYLSNIDKDNGIDKINKNEKIEFACTECIKLISAYHLSIVLDTSYDCFYIRSSYVWDKCYAYIDVLDPYKDTYECIDSMCLGFCEQAEWAMKSAAKCHTNNQGKKIYLREDGAESHYKEAKKLEVCAKRYDQSYTLPTILISPKEGGEGVENPRNSNSGGCYVATCVYGSYDCPEVWTLRRFRDYTLDETWYGRLFIKCYYATSPTLVKWFGNQKWFRTFCKNHLDSMVSKLNQHGIEGTKYTDKY